MNAACVEGSLVAISPTQSFVFVGLPERASDTAFFRPDNVAALAKVDPAPLAAAPLTAVAPAPLTAVAPAPLTAVAAAPLAAADPGR